MWPWPVAAAAVGSIIRQFHRNTQIFSTTFNKKIIVLKISLIDAKRKKKIKKCYMPKLNIKDLNNHASFKEFFEFVIAFFIILLQ